MILPQNILRGMRFAAIALFAIAGTLFFSSNVVAQRPAASLEQCRNGTAANPTGCVAVGGATGWVTGNAGSSNSHWSETEFVPYRFLFSNLDTTPGNIQTVIIGYDVFKSGVHAIDYLGTFNYTEMNADPCVGVVGCTLAAPTSFTAVPTETTPILVTPNTGQIPGVFTMWGGTLGSCIYVEPYLGGEERRIQCTFEAHVSNPVLAWGGHIAWQGDWGAGNSAGGITGSPYHMRLIDLNGQGGNQDRSLSADAVAIPAKVTIIKDVVNSIPGFPNGSIGFDFTASPLFGPIAFTLYDADGRPIPQHTPSAASIKVSSPINSFGVDHQITVSESVPNGWDLTPDSACTGTLFGASWDTVTSNNVVLTLQEGAIVTCTFVNQMVLEPTSAPASVSGRVATESGTGIYGAQISIINAETGETYRTITNGFGYYSIHDLPVSTFYVMNVRHKSYLFLDSSASFTLEDDIVDMNFTASTIGFRR